MQKRPRISPTLRVSLLTIALICAVGFLPLPNSWREWLRDRSEQTEQCKNVLFIGNSLTFMYDMPGIVADLSHTLAPQMQICPFRETYPGVTLQWHFEQGQARARLQERTWDYVVIQEQSGRSFEEPDEMERWIRLAAEEVHAVHATALLYSISSQEWGPQAQELLDQRMQKIAAESASTLVPVNYVWQLALRANPSARIYGSDHHHPGPFGAYLAAALFVKAIDGKIPNIWPSSLPTQPQAFKDIFFARGIPLDQSELAIISALF